MVELNAHQPRQSMFNQVRGIKMKYKNLQSALNKLASTQKQVDSISAKNSELNFENSTPKRRAAADDRLVSACYERDKALELFECELVNAGFSLPGTIEQYLPREIIQSAGHGHSLRLLHVPPVPECMKEYVEAHKGAVL